MTSKQLFDGAMKLSIERWRAEAAAAEAAGFTRLSSVIRGWIAAAEPIFYNARR